MSVETSDSMSVVWTDLEGHVVNGVFPLHRCIASSDHSGVFTTESAKHAPFAVALKLVRIDPTAADAQLSRLVAAAELSHPHLIRIFETGQCQVGELHCLYALMEYADQNLAQLLKQRALAEQEARELLVPTLSVLAYLHEREFVQGQLKPSNILAVGEQLKVASDTVRAVGKFAGGTKPGSAYDAPETRVGIYSTASDIWALGVTMCEALTRRQPSGPAGGVGDVELPSDLQPPFREIVGRCLSTNSRDRPDVAHLQAWLRGDQTVGAEAAPVRAPTTPLPRSTVSSSVDQPDAAKHSTAQTATVESVKEPQAAPVATATAKSKSNTTSTVRLVIRAEILPEEAPPPPVRQYVRQYLNRRALALVLGSVAVLTLSWIGLSVLRNDSASKPTVSEGGRDVESTLPPPGPAPSEAARVVGIEPHPKPATSTAEARSAQAKSVESEVRDEPDESPSPVKEVIPDVPRNALRTIRGTIRVTVRLAVDKNGTVVAATPDRPGPSRYFERLAVEASKKWTFAPAGTEAQRMVLVRFNFTREGTTARAIPVK